MNSANEIFEQIKEAKHVIFLTGAGVSTASGIPDYRSRNGLYNTQEGNKKPETLLSSAYLYNHPKEFHEFNKKIFDFCKVAKPNAIHRVMAKLIESNQADIIITQNIDNLHYRAFSENWKTQNEDRINYVIEYHGNDFIWHCDHCYESYNVTKDYPITNICPNCKRPYLRPSVVLYDEMIDGYKNFNAIMHQGIADLIIVVGTSLAVYPFANLAVPLKDQKLIIINQTETSMDEKADKVYHEDATKIFESIELLLEEKNE